MTPISSVPCITATSGLRERAQYVYAISRLEQVLPQE